MAVNVDVCEARVTCFDNICARFAMLAIDGGCGPRGYCVGHAGDRLSVHRQRGAEIVYTDAARQLLTREPGRAVWS